MTYRASLKWMIWFIVAIGLVFLPQGDSAEAAGINKVVTVSSTAIKSNPYSYGKKLGILREGAKVRVYYQTKTGWSEIRYKGKKAYVLSRHLHTSYSMNPNRVYVYKDMHIGNVTYTHLEKSQGWDVWEIDNIKGTYEILVSEDRNGSHFYNPYTDHYGRELVYPVKTGKKWETSSYGLLSKYSIISVTKTIKTPAGTFKNVVAVKDGETIDYYAPNVGYILSTYKGKTTIQLIKLK